MNMICLSRSAFHTNFIVFWLYEHGAGFYIQRDKWEESPTDLIDSFVDYYGEGNYQEQLDWAVINLIALSYDQLLILAEKCRNDPILLQKVMERYWEGIS